MTPLVTCRPCSAARGGRTWQGYSAQGGSWAQGTQQCPATRPDSSRHQNALRKLAGHGLARAAHLRLQLPRLQLPHVGQLVVILLGGLGVGGGGCVYVPGGGGDVVGGTGALQPQVEGRQLETCSWAAGAQDDQRRVQQAALWCTAPPACRFFSFRSKMARPHSCGWGAGPVQCGTCARIGRPGITPSRQSVHMRACPTCRA